MENRRSTNARYVDVDVDGRATFSHLYFIYEMIFRLTLMPTITGEEQ